MTKQKLNSFVAKCEELKNEELQLICNRVKEYVCLIDNLKFESFTNENPYLGEKKNKIFFTYSNAYKANSQVWMYVEKLHYPHVNFEDRGYIKGVAVDLHNYMKIQRINSLNHNYDYNIFSIQKPKFINNKNKDFYEAECEKIIDNITASLKLYVKIHRNILNKRLKVKTGCSLLHYIMMI